jgi:type II secretory pathway component PulK
MMRTNQPKRTRGVTLLITLIVLVILSILIVQFQTEATLHVRSNEFRMDRLQCRYAAESAIIVAGQIIKQAHRTPDILHSDDTPTAEPATEDPNLLAEMDLPPLEDAESQEEWPSFVLLKKTIEIGSVKVDMEIHDENAKWPLYWLARSPFESGSTTKAAQSFRNYTRTLGVSALDSRNVIKQVQQLARPLKLPEKAPVIIQKSSARSRLTRRPARIQYAQKVRERLDRNKTMAVFAAQWYQKLKEDPQFEPYREDLVDLPGTFADYISMWGTFEINVNTAPEELIYHTFANVGLTAKQAQAIVDRRNQKPFTNTGELQMVRGLGIELSNTIRGLCGVKSSNYSVHVDARLGRIRSRLLGGVYFDFSDRMQLGAVFSGD